MSWPSVAARTTSMMEQSSERCSTRRNPSGLWSGRTALICTSIQVKCWKILVAVRDQEMTKRVDEKSFFNAWRLKEEAWFYAYNFLLGCTFQARTVAFTSSLQELSGDITLEHLKINFPPVLLVVDVAEPFGNRSYYCQVIYLTCS